MVSNRDKTLIYACTADNCYMVSKYQRNDETLEWDRLLDLPRAEDDENEAMLQLKLHTDEHILFGTTNNGFIIWDFNDSEEEERIAEDAIVLMLPHGTRNISTKMQQSNSIMLSAKRNYAVAGVR